MKNFELRWYVFTNMLGEQVTTLQYRILVPSTHWSISNDLVSVDTVNQLTWTPWMNVPTVSEQAV
jgi:hypothetical protein